MLLVYYISMFVADAFLSKLYFKNIYLFGEFFVVEASDHFKISKKQNQEIVMVASLYTCPVYLERQQFNLAFRFF